MNRHYFTLLICLILVAACSGQGTNPPAAQTTGVALPMQGNNPPAAQPSDESLPVQAALPSATLPLLSDTPETPPTATLTSTPTPTAFPTVGAGSVMVARGDLRPLVYVPAGRFWMGAPEADTNALWDERPRHKLELDAFWIDLYEVTHIDYQACVSAGACKAPAKLATTKHSYAFAAEIEDAPVVNVPWQSAQDYCAWAGKRLPTEAEWEKAAHGEDSQLYPWGDDDPYEFALAWFGYIFSAEDPNIGDDFARPAPVGSFPEGASPYGLFDMAGNVWEWVQDFYNGGIYEKYRKPNPSGPESGTFRVVRGGGWTSSATELRTTEREARAPLAAWIDVGFRCVKDAETDANGKHAGLVYPGQPIETSTPTNTPLPPTATQTQIALPENLPLYALTFSGKDGRIYVVNSDGSGLKAITDGTVMYYYPAWSPVADTIAAIAPGDFNPAIWMMASDGSQLSKLFELPTSVQQFGGRNYDVESYNWVGSLQWSPDGTRLAFQSITDMAPSYFGLPPLNVHVISSVGSDFASKVFAYYPVWSPDSNRLAFVTTSPDLDQFAVVNSQADLAGDSVELCSSSQEGYLYPPDWSPDGRGILCVQHDDPGEAGQSTSVLYSVNPEATEWTRIHEQTGLPTWSPSGDEIAFVSYETGEPSLYAIHPDGTHLRVILANLKLYGGVEALSWSPDGTRLALLTGLGELYVVRADGKGGLVQVGTQLVPSMGYLVETEMGVIVMVNPPQWSPWPVEP